MTDAELAAVLAAKAERHKRFAEANADTEYYVQITIPVRGYERAVEMFNSMVDATNVLNTAYENEINNDNSYSAYVLDTEGNAVY